MKVKESIIRENISENLYLLDKSLKLVAQEHYIKMPDGKKAFIDILAKDDFGCFTVIELKKSNQTARSAIQQLLKYANFLKRKNRLEESQIRCVILSTVWDELEDPFSEFIEFSQYESKGYLVDYEKEKVPVFTEVRPEYKKGNLSPLHNFIFFEFNIKGERDKLLKEFGLTLKSLPSVNSVLIEMDYSGDDLNIINPFGFAWVMFTGDIDNMNLDMSKLESKKLAPEFFDAGDIISLWEGELPEFNIRSKILLEQVRINNSAGEYTGLALHSLNNTLATWNYSTPVGFGDMFNDGLFDEDEILSLACGFVGDHPYGFVTQTSPQRAKQFNFVRKKIDQFLAFNERWKVIVNHIFQQSDNSDVIKINIFNPLNFLGMINDVHKTNSSKRIPSLKITVEKESGTLLQYYGSLFWTNKKPIKCPKEAILKLFASNDDFKLRYLTNNYKKNEVSLTDRYGLSYEVVCSNGKILAIDGKVCDFVDFEELDDLQDFLISNDHFIDQVGDLFDELAL